MKGLKNTKLGARAGKVQMTEKHLTASTPCPNPPEWAVLQRRLFQEMEDALDVYLNKYTRPDGSLIYADSWLNQRDGLDDLYEAFYNLPLLYVLGGSSKLLERGHFHWEAINKQAADFGLVQDEYEVGFDQFHQSEGNLFFCLLCVADPENPVLHERARRFADLYLDMPNYDPDLNIIRAPHTGAGGPRWGYLDGHNIFNRFMENFGLPFHDIEGIASFEDVGVWNTGAPFDANRAKMIDAMDGRMGQGDCVANLLATCIVTNAYLITGAPEYKTWVETYAQGWWDRAAANNGILPDNVGLNGEVGSQFEGNWFGAAYGWTWPLGYDYIGDFVAVAGTNAALVSGRSDWLDLPGQLFDIIFEQSHIADDYQSSRPPRPDRWIVEATKSAEDSAALVAPKKHGAHGWFADYPFQVGALANTWCTSFDPKDRARLNALQNAEPQDWSNSYAFRSKGDDGHERPWLAYLDGDYDRYPKDILKQSLQVVAARRDAVEKDQSDLTKVHIHHWQNHNPVTTEALIQTTLGGPQQRYNGGSFRTCFRYFDEDENRPGLPQDIGALVQKIDAQGAEAVFVNLSTTAPRRLRVQGGFYCEHEITVVTPTASDEPLEVNGNSFTIQLPPATTICVRIGLKRLARQPKLSQR